MSASVQVRLAVDEDHALDACVVKITNLAGKPVTRPDAVKTLVRAYAAGMTVEELMGRDDLRDRGVVSVTYEPRDATGGGPLIRKETAK